MNSTKYIKALPLFIGLFVLSENIYAKSKVAWLQLQDSKGQVVQLEPNFYYAHVAIEVNGNWLHANPKSGVELVTIEALDRVGKIKEILESDEESVDFSGVEFFISRPFDHEYSWNDDKIYCAELVAKLLNIPPSPMHFDLKYWHPWFQKYEGLPGASPAKIYQELKNRGYHNSF